MSKRRRRRRKGSLWPWAIGAAILFRVPLLQWFESTAMKLGFGPAGRNAKQAQP